jgi:hypothetical protein
VTFDFEPEDAWDRDDAIVEQIRNLCDRIAALDGGPPGAGLDETQERLAAWLIAHQDDDGTPRAAHIRAGLLSHDLHFVRARL